MAYKECYHVDLIGHNVLVDAIDEWVKGQPPLTYEQEMQLKLAEVRGHIEYRNTWHTPLLSELKDGDIVQIQTSYGWSEGTWPDVLSHDTHVNLFGGKTIESKFNYASLRVRKK